MRFTFAVEGEEQIDRTLTRMADDLEDLRPVWEVLADRFVIVERRQFDTEGAYGSGGWTPLSPTYGAWKAAHYPGKGILERSGALRESLTRRPFGVEVIEAKSMTIGSGIDYGAYHQKGGGNLPQRRPVELPATERREWVKAVQRFVMTGVAVGLGARGGWTR